MFGTTQQNRIQANKQKTLPHLITAILPGKYQHYLPFLGGLFSDEKLAYATQVYRIIYGLPIIRLVDETDSKTLSYYLDSPSNLTLLEASLISKKPFIEKLCQVEYIRQNQKLKITPAEAERFIQLANEKIDKELKTFFSEVNLAGLQKKPSGENPYYTIDAGIILEAEAIAILDKIGPLYFKRVGKKFNVNSGTRGARRQADAMLGVIEAGGTNLPKYTNREAANEVLDAYKKAKAVGKSRDGIVQAMAQAIQNQIDSRGYYISKHMRAGAIDISVRGDVGVPAMLDAEQKIMIEIAKNVITQGNAFYESEPPHIHIQFK